MLKEFKKFIMRGNVLDLAVGVIIGGAFGAIVNSLVNDVIMPPIGLLLGKVDFNNLMVVLKEGGKAPGPYTSLAMAQDAGAVTLNYGKFINTILIFLIVALAIFLVVRLINRFYVKEQLAPAEPVVKSCPYCYKEIPIKATRCPFCTSKLE